MISSEGDIQYLDLEFRLDAPAVTKRIAIRGVNRDFEGIASSLVEKVTGVARPRAIFRASVVESTSPQSFKTCGVVFSSRVLPKLFGTGDLIFPYIVSIGPELDALDGGHDMLGRYWLDIAKTMVLQSAGDSFSRYLRNNYGETRLTHMNPGELNDWPVTQQRQLFSLFDGVASEIGVFLTDGCMIRPTKSRSGIFFQNEDGFETCRLCTQRKCPGRRAAYNEETVALYTA